MRDAKRLDGRRVIVTGASRGIGHAIAIACAREGATVGLGFLQSEREAQQTAEEIGPGAVLLRCDVRDTAAVNAAFERFVQVAGGLDGLVNNAGIIRPSLLVSATDEDIEATIRTNLFGTIACTRAALRVMLRAHGGVIVNVGSVAASQPFRGQAVYAATKGAIEAFTKAVAIEYGRKGIRCECLSPGPVDTAMFASTKALAGDRVLEHTPWRQFVPVEAVADLAVQMLADPAAVDG